MSYINGPWYKQDAFIESQIEIRDKDRRRVAVVVTDYPNGPKRAAAYSQLIAAATDMYEALKPFAEFACDDWEAHQCHNCEAKRALAKADGVEL